MTDVDDMKGFYHSHEDMNNWSARLLENVDHLSFIMKMIDNSQSELLQAQIDLQDGQNQIRKLEVFLRVGSSDNFENENSSSYFRNSNQINKNNDQESTKIMELQNEITLVQKDNRNVKKHLESVFLSNSQLQNGIEWIKKEMKKKDQVIQSMKEEIQKSENGKKEMESTIAKLNSEINVLKLPSKEHVHLMRPKVYSRDIMESMPYSPSDELLKKLKEYEVTIKEQENKIFQYSEKNKIIEAQVISTRQNFHKEMQCYEEKVKEVIEKMKIQKDNLEEQSNKLLKELKTSKRTISEINESYKQILLQLDAKEEEIQTLKAKLMEKFQLEDREKLLKRELDENLIHIHNYKTQIMDINLEKDKYFNKNCEQDITIRHLLNQIKSLQDQLKVVKQPLDRNAWNESISTSSVLERNNISTPVSPSTTEGLNDHTQSLTNYIININNRSNENNCENDNFKHEETDAINHSDFDSEENTIQKLACLIKNDQFEYSRRFLTSKSPEISAELKHTNDFLIRDDFSKYLEEQLRLIKMAGEKNLASIKRELTINSSNVF